MKIDNLADLKEKLKPWVMDLIANPITVVATQIQTNMVVHALDGSDSWHIGQLALTQIPNSVAGAGLAAATGVLSVGAGTLITVGQDTVGITDGSTYQFIGTGAGTSAAWQNLSGLAGAGMTATNGVLNVIAADTSITVNADSLQVALATNSGLAISSGLKLGSVDTLSVSSTSNITTSAHGHAITSSSSPGGAAALLASAADGGLQLLRFGIGADPDTDNRLTMVDGGTLGNGTLLTFSDTANDLDLTGARFHALFAGEQLRLDNDGTHYTAFTTDASGNLLIAPSGALFNFPSTVRFQSSTYVSQLTGVGITGTGSGDFRYIYADELHAKAFIADLEQALAGGQIISKSVAEVASDFTLPAAGAAGTLVVKDLPGASAQAVFQSGDIVRLRQFVRTAGSLTIADAWGVVTAYADNADGTQNWTFTRSSAPNAGTASGMINANTLALDYGVTGNGFYEVNAIDGAWAVNSPYSQIVTWATHPATGKTLRTRLGNLYGVTGVTEYGLYAGDGAVAATNKFLRLSNQNAEIHNLPLNFYNGATQTASIQADGDAFFGSAIAAPATTSLVILSNAQTYNSESLGAADILLGDNTASKANILWDRSAGTFLFRSGITTNMTLNTDGSLIAGTVGGARLQLDKDYIAGYSDATTKQWYGQTSNGKLYAGAGVVVLDVAGIAIIPTTTSADVRSYKIANGATVYSTMSGWVSAGENALTLHVNPISGKVSSVTLQAESPTGQVANAILGVWSADAGLDCNLTLHAGTTVATNYAIFTNTAYVTIPGGLNVGSATGAGTGCIATPAESWIGPSTTTGIYFEDSNVGVGIMAPAAKLVVNAAAGTDADIAFFTVGAGGDRQLRIRKHNVGTGGIILQSQDSDESGTANSNFRNLLLNPTSGSVGIGVNPTSTYRLHVQSAGTTNETAIIVCCNSASTLCMYVLSSGYGYLYDTAWHYGPSERKYKTNIVPIVNALDIIGKLKPSQFDYKDGRTNKVGFIAEDMQKVLPHLVSNANLSGNENFLAIATTDLIPYYAAAFQEIDTRLTALEMKT